jgi:hypothetical protein
MHAAPPGLTPAHRTPVKTEDDQPTCFRYARNAAGFSQQPLPISFSCVSAQARRAAKARERIKISLAFLPTVRFHLMYIVYSIKYSVSRENACCLSHVFMAANVACIARQEPRQAFSRRRVDLHGSARKKATAARTAVFARRARSGASHAFEIHDRVGPAKRPTVERTSESAARHAFEDRGERGTFSTSRLKRPHQSIFARFTTCIRRSPAGAGCRGRARFVKPRRAGLELKWPVEEAWLHPRTPNGSPAP